MRERVLELGLFSVLGIALGTEALGALGAISFWPVSLLWLGMAVGSVWRLRGVKLELERDWVVQVCLAGITLVWVLEGVAALAAPPNSADAMAYHMPRIVYWMQQKSVANFATQYLNQIMLQPLFEYVAMHFQVLTGGDSLANAVAWLSTGGYVLAASLVAQKVGAGLRGQALAALAAATLPNGILQASSMKNEALLAFLMLSAIYYGYEKRDWHCGVAVGLACLTKGTAYLFAWPIVFLIRGRALPQVAVAALVINGAFYTRNIDLSGSPLGFDSANADGVYVWKNEPLGVKALVSNAIRHATEHLGGPNRGWNAWLYAKASGLHGRLGINPYEEGTTWPFTRWEAPSYSIHEGDLNNRWHLLLGLAALGYAIVRKAGPVVRLGLVVALAGAGICFYLKWQPSMVRMWLPLFAVLAAAIGWWAGKWPGVLQAALALALVYQGRHMLTRNAIRPLAGEQSIFLSSRNELRMRDMVGWKVAADYEKVMGQLDESGCKTVAFDISYFQLEYPIQARLLERDRAYRFVHVATTNPSVKYERRWAGIEPCVVVCLACDRWFEKVP